MLPSSWPAWPALKREGEGGIWARERACGAREEEKKGTPARTLSFPPRAPHTLSRAPKFPTSPSRFNAGHAGYLILLNFRGFLNSRFSRF